MNLSEVNHQLLTPARLKALKDFRAETLPQFLSKDPEHLVNILRISYTEVLDLTEDLLVAHTTFPRTSIDLYQKHVQSEVVLSSGSVELDKILRGGFKTGLVYEIYGPAGAGKTQLCLGLAVSSIIKAPENIVCYIDTKNDLFPERVLQIYQARSVETKTVSSLANIEVFKCFNLDPILEALEAIATRTSEKHNTTKLVILDNIISPIMFLISTEMTLAYSYASMIVQLLQRISHNGVSVVCSNHARFADEEYHPALGTVWASLADIRMRIAEVTQENPQHNGTASKENSQEIAPSSCENQRRITVVKGYKSAKTCDVSLGKSGISDVNVNAPN